MKGRAHSYSEFELAFVKARAEWSRSKLHAEFCRVFGRTDVTVDALKKLCLRNGWLTGRDGRFVKGAAPHNLGKPMRPHPNSIATRFKTGTLNGRAASLYQPIGSERLSKEGYLQRKVADKGPANHRWRCVHRIRWEEVNGPLPKGMALKSLNGDRLDTDPSNWVAVPRALLARLAGKSGRDYDNAPPEMKPTLLAIARLEQKAHELRKAARNG